MAYPIHIREAVFDKSIQLARDVYNFKFSVSDFRDLVFQAGQYVILCVSGNVKRSYSIATPPSLSRNKFELIANIVSRGAGSSYLMGLKAGQKISFLGPAGNFILPQKPDKNLFFICTGTGIAPIKSMIEELAATGQYRKHRIYFIFGTETRDKVLCGEIFDKLNKKKVISSYDIYLSRERTREKYNFGYVTKLIENYDSVLLKGGSFFVCGNPDMVKSVKEVLENNGVDSNKIRFEAYG